MSNWLTIATSLIAVLAFVDSILTRYVRAKSRRYAAENDFAIMRNEFQVLKSSIDKIEADVQRLERSVAVIEAISRRSTTEDRP